MKKVILTAVIPAENGCNLNCVGCFITQRGEASQNILTNDDYFRFVGDALTMPEVVSFSLQGYEPLLPEAWPLAKKLLTLATKAKTSTGVGKRVLCVTNGVCLDRFADEIVHITDNLSVSIDSHDSAIHDWSRRKTGAWQATVGGIRAVRALFGTNEDVFKEYLSVVSILYPNKVERLIRMPELLSDLGVKRWTISPFISIPEDGFHGDASIIRNNLLELVEEAEKQGVEVFLGDDLRQLESADDLYQVLSIAAIDGEHTVVRLSPDSSLSIGKEILGDSMKSKRWDRKESPIQFLRRVVPD